MNEYSDGIADTRDTVWTAFALTKPSPRLLARGEAGGPRLFLTKTASGRGEVEPESNLDWALASLLRSAWPPLQQSRDGS